MLFKAGDGDGIQNITVISSGEKSADKQGEP